MPVSGKRIRLSGDNRTSWFTLPGNSGEFTNEGQVIDDTIFGQLFKSGFPGLINWSASASALYKGFAGYQCVINSVTAGSTVMTDEATTFVSGKTYQITSATRRILDTSVAVIVEDNNVAVSAANILSIDYLFGRVTFISSYTVTGPVTITGAYRGSSQLAGTKDFTLTMTAEAIDETTMPVAQTNDGHRVFSQGLKTVEFEASGLYALSNGFRAALISRAEVLLEIRPTGTDETVFRGFFRYTNQSQSGDVGALEEENINLTLSVPAVDTLELPFSVSYNNSTLSQAVRIAIDAFLNGTEIDVQYLPNGTTGLVGNCIITDVSLSGGLEAMNMFEVGIQGTGQVAAVT